MKMPKTPMLAGFVAVSSFALLAAPSHAQLAGSIDNFDVVNDTGETAEGFEVEMDDVSSADVNNADSAESAQSFRSDRAHHSV